MGLVAQSDGHDEPGLVPEPVPRRAAVVEDIWVGGAQNRSTLAHS
jgi:hypothetical protein